ncbi:unnamed protein product [Symbiodinium microadriaticum]|nr:unnamed protein product [Symbiodinium microadriaticum]
MGGIEPVIHVHARDSLGNSVGIVVVPIGELVALEVWDVWYAMDDGSDEMDEKPAEETPKMHLLLQSVPAEAASQETKQSRDMRAQDFLLRALQQLNAALEAKEALPGPRQRQTLGFAGASARASAQDPSEGLGAPAPGAPAESAPAESAPAESAPASCGRCGRPDRSARGGRQAGRKWCWKSNAATGTSTGHLRSRRRLGMDLALPWKDAAPVPEPSNGTSAEEKEERQRAQEEAFKLRLEPYERAIAAMEQKQRLYDDQEARIQALSKALEEQQGRSGHLVAQLREEADRAKAEAEQERESLREVTASRTFAQQRAAELEQEVALRRSHEESLQHRLSLLETQASAASQKSLAAQAVEEEAQKALADVEALRKQRQRLQEQLQELGRELSETREENWQLKEDRGHEVEKARSICEREKLAKESMQLEVLQLQDQLRDKEAEARLALERAEGSQRRVETLEAEVTSLQSLLARERQHRAELDQKLNETEMQKLHSTLDEHRVLVRGLRLDLDKARRELSDERGRICATERVRPISSSSRFVRIVFTRRVQHCVMAADTFRGLGSRHLPLCMFCPCPFLLGSWKWLRRDTRQRWPPPQSWR